MIHDLTPYPVMKDSGVPWLGPVPEHWGVTRSKWLFSSSKELAHPDDVQLSATQAYGVIPQEEYERRSGSRVVKISMHLDKRKHVEQDDFIISMRSFQGGLERAWASGAIRSSYVILKPGPNVNVGFFAHLLKSRDYILALQATAGFIRDGQDLTESDFRKVDLPLVPVIEQAAIVRFLDHADRRIRRTIAAKQRLIKLLQEQKQVIIHQAVTRGLDPNAKLKPSGVEWLGDLPEGWEVKRLKYLLGERDLRSENGVEQLLRVSQYTGVTERRRTDGGNEPDTRAASLIGYKKVIPEELVVNIMLAWNGSMGVSKFFGIASPAYCVYEFQGETYPWYFHYLLRSPIYKARIKNVSIGIVESRLRLYTDDLYRLEALLPSFNEQVAIVRFIEEATAELSVVGDQAFREIALLREYRTRLIADVVTGKFDVRGAAARLPELGAEALPDEVEADVDESDADEAEVEEGVEA